ncbi:hypothetical protein QQF64_005486, partial [Cirrhinus molitorella]
LTHLTCFFSPPEPLGLLWLSFRVNSHIKGSNTRMLNRSQTMFSESPDGSHYHHVIHTVGPIARGNLGQTQKDDLEACYKNSLKLMKDNNLRSVAFPCISTGIY